MYVPGRRQARMSSNSISLLRSSSISLLSSELSMMRLQHVIVWCRVGGIYNTYYVIICRVCSCDSSSQCIDFTATAWWTKRSLSIRCHHYRHYHRHHDHHHHHHQNDLFATSFTSLHSFPLTITLSRLTIPVFFPSPSVVTHPHAHPSDCNLWTCRYGLQQSKHLHQRRGYGQV